MLTFQAPHFGIKMVIRIDFLLWIPMFCVTLCVYFFKSLTDFFSEANRRDILSDARLLDVLLEMTPQFGHTFDA